MSSPTTVCEFGPEKFDTYVICPEEFGFSRCAKAELEGGTPWKTPKLPGIL
jgi:anthranilate phosphoribosyltransferase